MKKWTTKEGIEIPYNRITTDYLKNILKFIKNLAKEGMQICYGYGYSGEDDFPTGDVETVYGKQVLEQLDYKGLLAEFKKRK